MTIFGHSRGLLSSWNFFPEWGLLIDVGDGAALRIHRQVGSIKYIAITHEHFDHITGLTALLNLKWRLNPSHPVTLFLPGHHSRFDALIEPLGSKGANLNIVYVEPGKTYPMDGKRVLKPFKTDHSKLSVGYLVQTQRTKLKPEFTGLPQAEIVALRKQNIEIQETLDHTLLAYTGDTKPLKDLTPLMNADLVMHEATYLQEEDEVSEPNHSFLAEVKQIFDTIKAKEFIIMHVSPRYNDQEALAIINQKLPNAKVQLGYRIIH